MTATVRYAIKQVSTYTYASGVPFARHVVRLAPVTRPGIVVEAATVRIDPEPDERSERRDFFGNATLDIALERPHRKLEIACTAMVSIARPVPVAADTTPAWEQVRGEVAVASDAGPTAPVHHLFASRLVPVDPLIRTWAAESFPPGVPVLAGGLSLMARIKKEFAYDPEATDVTTPTHEAFKLRRGVCQDFAHVMICGLRSLGLPAAYVSGYLRTLPPPGKPRLEGADAMHAWVALWCGEAAGWQGLDPTNDIRAGTDHIVVAIGRDYADVSPTDGVIIAAGGHSLEVGVDVVER